MTWLAASAAALALALLVGPRPSTARGLLEEPAPRKSGGPVWGPPVLAVLAGLGAALFVGGAPGLVAAPTVAAGAWVVLARSEPTAVRRRRERVARDLPHVVTLLAATLRSGATPAEALRLVARALPGPATERLQRAVAHLDLGADPTAVWAEVAREPGLAPLGRALARSQATGGSVVAAVDRLSEELAREARGEVEDRARAVGVKAALPLGLCLLPSFLLLGIVPLAAGLLATVTR